MGSKVREQHALCPLPGYAHYGTENVPFHFMRYVFWCWIHPNLLLPIHV